MSLSLVGFSEQSAAHSALLKLTHDIAAIANAATDPAAAVALSALSVRRTEAEWVTIAESVQVELIETGFAEISALGLMPARSPYTVTDMHKMILPSLLRRETPDARVIRAARLTGLAFFSWALSGINHLSAIGQYVVGLAGTAAAQIAARDEQPGKGAAYRLKKIGKIKVATQRARQEAATRLLVRIGYALTA